MTKKVKKHTVNKLYAGISVVSYGLGAACLIMIAKTAMLTLELVSAAAHVPDVLFTNKFLYFNILILLINICLVYIATLGFRGFFSLGLLYWKLAFGGNHED